jgi:hypothetical protein
MDRGPGSTEACSVRETSRDPLTVEDGRLLYVEPGTFSVSGDQVLLAGTPNFLTTRAPGGEVVALVEDSVFGAVLAADGTARTVASPVDGRLVTGVRGTPRAGGGWDVVFAEVTGPGGGTTRPDTAARLWHGVYDGRQWLGLEELPRPSGVTLHPRLASSLLRYGDTLAWAVSASRPEGPRQIALFQKRDGVWSHEIIETQHARVNLAHSEELGLILVVVQADVTLRSDGNSLFLWARSPEWQPLRRLVHGYGEGVVNDVAFSLAADGGVATWHTSVWEAEGTARIEMRAMRGRLEYQREAMVVVDSSVTGFGTWLSPVVGPGGARIWITDHVPTDGRRSELRFTTESGGSVAVLERMPNPYHGFIAAVTPAPGEILLTGLHYVPNRYIVSLLLRTRIRCHGGTS